MAYRSPTATSAAARIPNELLIQIFLHRVLPEQELQDLRVEEPYEEELKHVTPSRPWRAAVRLGEVCHTWRAVSLAVPQLWSYLSVGPETTQLEEMASRSKDQPLSLYMRNDPTRPVDPPLPDGLFAVLPRVVSLEISPPFIDWFPYNIPHLRTLILQGSRDGTRALCNQMDNTSPLAGFQSLERIFMCDSCFPHQLSVPHTATLYNVSFLDLKSTSSFGFLNILVVLSCMPNLCDLFLDLPDLVDEPRDTAYAFPHPRLFNRLGLLFISSLPVYQCDFLLGEMETPNLVTQEYSLQVRKNIKRESPLFPASVEGVQNTIRDFLRTLGFQEAATERPTYRYALLKLEECCSEISLWNDPSIQLDPKHEMLDSVVPVVIEFDDFDYHAEVPCIDQALTVSILQNLEISGLEVAHFTQRSLCAIRNSPVNATMLHRFSSAHPSLTEIHVDHFAAIRLVYLLRQRLPEEFTVLHPNKMFPSLRSLHFHRVMLSHQKKLQPLYLQLEYVAQ